MKRPPRIVFVLLLVLLGVGVWYFFFRNPKVHDPDRLTLFGDVDIRQVNLSFRAPGRVETMPFEEGDSIEAGQVIATLDPVPFGDEIQRNQAQIGVQAANLDKLERGTRWEEVAQAESTVAERQATLQNARQLLQKNTEAVKLGLVTRQEFDTAQAQVKEAEARLTNARQALTELRNGSRQEDVEAARANVRAARAQLSQSRLQQSYIRLVSPSSGVIQTRVREPGSVVQAGDPVYALTLTTPKWVQAYVEEPDLGRIKPGMKASIVTDSRPKTPYTGQIGFISPVAEFTPKAVETQSLRTSLVYPIRVIVTDPENDLRQGMPVTVNIETPHHEAKKTAERKRYAETEASQR